MAAVLTLRICFHRASDGDFTDGEISVLDLLAKTKLVPSKGEARRLIDQGGISIDDEKVNSVTAKISKSSFEKGFVIIKKGKKVYHKAILLKPYPGLKVIKLFY